MTDAGLQDAGVLSSFAAIDPYHQRCRRAKAMRALLRQLWRRGGGGGGAAGAAGDAAASSASAGLLAWLTGRRLVALALAFVALLWLMSNLLLCGSPFFFCGGMEMVQNALEVESRPLVTPRCRVAEGSADMGHNLVCVANTFFLGASKCGTTSMRNMLGRHPQIAFVERPKGGHEVHQFDMPWKPGWREMVREWQSAPRVSSGHATVMHYTPNYVYAPLLPFDLHRIYPRTKEGLRFFIMLREPMSRMQSSYWYKRSRPGLSKGSVKQLVKRANKQWDEREAYEVCRMRIAGSRLDHAGVVGTYSSRALTPMGWTIVPPPGDDVGSSVSGSRRLDTFDNANREREHLNQYLSTARAVRWWEYTQNPEISDNIEALRKAEQRALHRCWGPLGLRDRYLKMQHVDKSIYADQLFRWFLNFPPAWLNGVSAQEAAALSTGGTADTSAAETPSPVRGHRYLVITLEEYRDQPLQVMRRIASFLDIPLTGENGFASTETALVQHASSLHSNPNTNTHTAPLEMEDKKVLAEKFHRPNKRLMEILDLPQPLYPT